MVADRIVFSWSDIRDRAETVADRIVEDCFGGSSKLMTTQQSWVSCYAIPRGGLHAAEAVNVALASRGAELRHVSHPTEAEVIIDDLVDSGGTMHRVYDLLSPKQKDMTLLCALVDKEQEGWLGRWVTFPWERARLPWAGSDEELGPTDAVTRLLQFIGEDPSREGLLETPARVIKSYGEIFGGYKQNPEDHLKTFTDGACDEMVVLKDCEFYSVCEHHMQPFFGKAHIAYIPYKKVIGISKLARLLDTYARRLQIQERLTQQVTTALMDHLKPVGAACVIEAKHFCMVCRGVGKQNSKMITSSMQGAFRDDSGARTELLNLLRD